MNVKQLFADEDAVSPVIGVILMVAITVILAAVIGTFVLGLGENVQDSAPQANFQFEYGGNPDTTADDFVNITHTGGEDVDASNVDVQVDGSAVATAGSDDPGRDWSTDPISTGTEFSIDETRGATNTDLISGGETVRVVWTSASGGTSNTIGKSTVPS